MYLQEYGSVVDRLAAEGAPVRLRPAVAVHLFCNSTVIYRNLIQILPQTEFNLYSVAISTVFTVTTNLPSLELLYPTVPTP